MTNTMGRVQVIYGTPPLAPGKCVMCGTTESKFFIDIGFELDFYGIIYWCCDCITEIAQTIDYISPNHYESIIESRDELAVSLVKTTDENKELRNALASLNRLVFPDGATNPLSSQSEVPSSDSPTDEQGIERNEQGSSEQVNVGGSTYVDDTNDSSEDTSLSDFDI